MRQLRGRRNSSNNAGYLSRLVAPSEGGAWTTIPWTYTRSGASETVQTSESTLVSGIGENIARVGRQSSSKNFGLVIEVGITNYVNTPRKVSTLVGSGSGATISASGVVGPDGTSGPEREQVPLGSYGRFEIDSPTATNATTGSVWMRSTTGGNGSLRISSSAGTGYEFDYVLTNNWQRIVVTDPSSTNYSTYHPNDARGLGVPATAKDSVIDYMQLEKLPYVSEVTLSTTRGQDTLTAPKIGRNGRVTFYMRHRPKMPSTALDANKYLLYTDANNYILLNSTSRKVTCNVAGSAYEFSTACATWSRDDVVEWEIACGGGVLPSTCVCTKNGTATIMGISPAAQGTWAGATGVILSDGFSSWVEEVSFR